MPHAFISDHAPHLHVLWAKTVSNIDILEQTPSIPTPAISLFCATTMKYYLEMVSEEIATHEPLRHGRQKPHHLGIRRRLALANAKNRRKWN
jgi:hypothetical protein